MNRLALTLLTASLLASAALARACPFCTVVRPTLSERREAAAQFAVGEALEPTEEKSARFRVRQVLQPKDSVASAAPIVVSGMTDIRSGRLALLFAVKRDDGALAWEAVPADEALLGYAAAAPDLRRAPVERLRYFARFLEHADPAIAEDAYGEFGRAPYDVVARIAADLPQDRVRRWFADRATPPERRGLYALLLGLAADPQAREQNAALLRAEIEKPGSDFRAGFDGMLGGLLAADGERGLEWIERRFLADPRARRGDVLHAMTALRVQEEFGAGLERERLARAMARLLDRPDCAAAAIVDLARWQAWDELPRVVALPARPEFAEPAVIRAAAGYLLACPRPEAAAVLARLRQSHPTLVEEVERQPLLPSAR